MNLIIKFYATILSFLQSEVEEVGAVDEIVTLAKKAHPSWETTEENVCLLEMCVLDHASVLNDDTWAITRNDFIKCAFKDLSVLKNPNAMRVYSQLERVVLNKGDLFIWARKVRAREDGSAVIVLHVSDLQKFRNVLEESPDHGIDTEFDTLEECIMLDV